MQQLLEAHQNVAEKEKIIEELSTLINSEVFKNQLKETVPYRGTSLEKKDKKSPPEDAPDSEEKEAQKATDLFQYILGKVKGSGETVPDSKTKVLATFLEGNESFILCKIKSGIETVKADSLPSHPLFPEFCSFIEEISRFDGSVPEHGAHLIQQLLYFPGDQLPQARVIIESLLDRVKTKKFQEGRGEGEEEEEEEKDAYRVEKLARLNEIIEVTRKRPLLFASNMDKEGGIPEKLKVSWFMFRDPRIQVFNFYFEQEKKNAFDRKNFDASVSSIVDHFTQLKGQKKIFEEMDYDPETKKHGTADTLRNFLTNGEKFGQSIPNGFGHRILKIHKILEELDEDTVATLLGSWAAAGLHCTTRSESETHRFYTLYNTSGQTQESEIGTLEMRVALILAQLRRTLLHKLVPESATERVHQIAYLEKNHGKKLGLVDPQTFKDSHEKIVQKRYKNAKTAFIKGTLWNGGRFSNLEIMPSEAYSNPTVLIDYLKEAIVKKVANLDHRNKNSPTVAALLNKRFEKLYKGEELSSIRSSYYGEYSLNLTESGVRALLYSLGYLEK